MGGENVGVMSAKLVPVHGKLLSVALVDIVESIICVGGGIVGERLIVICGGSGGLSDWGNRSDQIGSNVLIGVGVMGIVDIRGEEVGILISMLSEEVVLFAIDVVQGIQLGMVVLLGTDIKEIGFSNWIQGVSHLVFHSGQ